MRPGLARLTGLGRTGLGRTGLGLAGLHLTGLGLAGPRLAGLGLADPRPSGPRLTGPRLTGPRLTGLRLTGLRLTGLRLALVASLFGACVPQPVYSVRRSALVPHLAPPARSGQPLDGEVGLGLHDSTVVVPLSPVEAPGANAGLWVARTNYGGAMRVRASSRFEVSFMGEVAPSTGAMPIASDMPDSPGGVALGGGAGVQYSAPVGERLRLAVAFDLYGFAIPFEERGTCVENCEGVAASYDEHGSHMVAVYSLALLPSYRAGRTTVFGGVTVRNQPRNFKGSVQQAWVNEIDDGAEVSGGPANVLLGGGVEWRLARGVAAHVLLYQPVTRDPVAYGPSIGVGLTLATSDRGLGRGARGVRGTRVARGARTPPDAPPPATADFARAN